MKKFVPIYNPSLSFAFSPHRFIFSSLSPSPFHLFPEFSLYFTCSFSPSRMGFSLFQLFSLQMQWLSPERCQRRPMFPASTFIVRFSFHSSIFSSLLGVLYLVQTISQILVVWVWIELVKKWVKGIWDFFEINASMVWITGKK